MKIKQELLICDICHKQVEIDSENAKEWFIGLQIYNAHSFGRYSVFYKKGVEQVEICPACANEIKHKRWRDDKAEQKCGKEQEND